MGEMGEMEKWGKWGEMGGKWGRPELRYFHSHIFPSDGIASGCRGALSAGRIAQYRPAPRSAVAIMASGHRRRVSPSSTPLVVLPECS